jgi:hypothetical protein
MNKEAPESILDRPVRAAGRWILLMAMTGACIAGIASQPLLSKIWILLLCAGLSACYVLSIYLPGRQQRLLFLNELLLIPSLIAAALALEGGATKLKTAGLVSLAQTLLGLSDFIKAYWWILFFAGAVVLRLVFKAREKRSGLDAAASGLRGLILAQISLLAILGAAIILTIRN